jgi:hypothetical protein
MSNTTETKNVIGVSKGKYKDLHGNENMRTGTDKDIKATGSTMQDYENVIIRINMGNRASTNPIKKDGTEGYPTSIQVVQVMEGRKRMASDSAEQHNKHIAWRQVGNPNDFLWLLPAGRVKAGDVLKNKAEWVSVTDRSGNVISANFELHIEVPEAVISKGTLA